MSLPLKPLTIDSNSKQLDSKQKKFNVNVLRALEHFDSVTEWADYIASLGKLLKALQSWSPQFQNVRYYVPSPYQVSRRLTSSLSPNLPAGVHQKTLEVYTFIFEKIGQDILASECNIWIPGILPLMTYASMSVKSHLIDLFDNHLVQLPSSTLKLLIRPMLASLLPGIDDESSEFQPLSIKLIETLQENLADNSLFWQTCFLIMIANKDRRLGGLVWLTKKFPSMNSVPHLVLQKNKESADAVKEDGEVVDAKTLRNEALSLLLPEAKDLLTPDPGLLVRSLACCLDDGNDLLIKRGIWDLLLQRLHLDSPVLNALVSEADKQLLILSCCRTTLAKDMSLNRRVWNWLVGPAVAAQANTNNSVGVRVPKSDTPNQSNGEYFNKHGLQSLIAGLKDMLESESSITTAYSICYAVMDRWEIGSLVIPEMFIPLLTAAQKHKDDKRIMKAASAFFDSVETNIIWGKLFHFMEKHEDLQLLEFVLESFSIASDEEIIVRHLPLILLAILSIDSQRLDSLPYSREASYRLCRHLLEKIPERAFLPLESSRLDEDGKNNQEVLEKISEFYDRVSNPVMSQTTEKGATQIAPFDTQVLSLQIFIHAYELLIRSLEEEKHVNAIAAVFVMIFDKIPKAENEGEASHSTKHADDQLVELLFKRSQCIGGLSDSVFGMVDVFSNYLCSKIPLSQSCKLLQQILTALWGLLASPKKQLRAVKSLQTLESCACSTYLEGAISHAFIKENDISQSLKVLELLWNHLDPRTKVVSRPLELMIDELFAEENPHYLSVSKWILSVVNSGTANRLFFILTDKILQVDFLSREMLEEWDDLDMFTYRIRSLTSVLKTNNGIVINTFSSELTSISSLIMWGDADISTYKNLMIAILMRFLEIKNNTNAKSVRSALILLECILDGTERNFKEIVIVLLQMSSKYIAQGGLDSELIAVSLLNIVSRVLRLSHENGIKLDIFDDDSTHLKYVDYLVTSVSTMESPLIVTSYMNLLSESMIYFESAMFRMILPLSASIVQCVRKLFAKEKDEGGYYQSISQLLNGLEQLLEVSHGFLSAEEKDGYSVASGSKGDFLQAVVSNVFSSEVSSNDVKIQGERDVVLQSFREVISCCHDIWSWAHGLSIMTKEDLTSHTNHSSYKFKFTVKKLLEKLFNLEPLEVMEALVMAPSNETLTLIHVLDGNRPALTLPYFFLGVVSRQNKNSGVRFSISASASSSNAKSRMEASLSNKLDAESLMRFLISYTSSLENAAIEDFYIDFLQFFKEISANYNLYENISKSVLNLVAVIAMKLQKSKFGEDKRTRRDLADTFMKYLPNSLGESPFNYSNPVTAFSDLRFVVSRIQDIINDEVGSDKFNNAISIIVSQCISPYLKVKNAAVPVYVLDLANETARVGGKVKNWRSLVNDFFLDNKKFSILSSNPLWDSIIFQWSHYPDNKTRLMNDMLAVIGSKVTSITPALITFNSRNDSEIEAKCQNLLRIAYLLMISPPDFHLLYFQPLISSTCQFLLSADSALKERSWILLRGMLLKFDAQHFIEYWSLITYCLQTNLQEFCETLQIQGEIHSGAVFQACKTLDLLLLLNLEGFSSTNEWLFVIDTINCIYKNHPFVALVDEIYECKEFESSKADDLELVDRSRFKVPALKGIHSIQSYTQLRGFFQNLSYAHYEYIYGLERFNMADCQEDMKQDIFA